MAHRPRDIHGVRRPLVELDAARRSRRSRSDRHRKAPEGMPPAPWARESMHPAMVLAVIAVLYLSLRRLTGRRWILSWR
jgi:hypothetical protein